VNTSSAVHPTFTVHGDSLNDVHQFAYLGSILTSDCDLNNKIQQRVKLLRVKSSKKFKSNAGVARHLNRFGTHSNERVLKQNRIEALRGDCNTLEETGRFP